MPKSCEITRSPIKLSTSSVALPAFALLNCTLVKPCVGLGNMATVSIKEASSTELTEVTSNGNSMKAYSSGDA